MFAHPRHRTAGAVPFGVTDSLLYPQMRAAPQDADMNIAIGLRRTGGPPSAEDVRALPADVAESRSSPPTRTLTNSARKS